MNPLHSVTRRDVIKTMGAGVALVSLGALASSSLAASAAASGLTQPFSLPKLNYGYDALEPHLDARTMEIHHTKHHQAYINNANQALAGQASLQKMSAEELLRSLDRAPEAIRTTLRNNVGGHHNHALFWQMIGPKAGGTPKGPLADAMTKTFGSFDAFKTQFGEAAAKRFGSGWAWLTRRDGKLAISSTANQDSPLSEGTTPLLGLDVWEHAYYLKYQNRRADYIAAFWNVVNWEQITANFAASK